MTEERKFPDFEKKWQQLWAVSRKPAADQPGKKTDKDFYILSMFPYPSGRLHFGHALPYTLTDSIARYKRMCGCNVLNPMGWDAFGLPAENAAIEAVRRGDKNVHPARMTYDSIETMRKQMNAFGYSFDWEREVYTCRADYYKWTQWIFLKMHERGIAYRKKARVNWCTDCKTTLANEQVETHVKDGEEFQACFRCGTPVEPREIDAWFLGITKYADRLLAGLDDLNKSWPELVTTQQRNWIGRSEGVNIDFTIELRAGASGSGPLKPPGEADANVQREKLGVFTTRADTVFGVTYVAIAPEHPLVERILKLVDARTHKRITEFVKETLSMTEQDRASGDEKEGVATGMFAVNPLSGEKIPVFVANYVLMYGTGAVMAVPAHDERDHEFAREYRLPMKQVIQPVPGSDDEVNVKEEAYTAQGVLIESGAYTGATSAEAIARIGADLAAKNSGGPVVNFKLRDWGISRQRYWGCPIPMIHCAKCGVVPVPEKDLPVMLPDDVDFLPTGRSPLTLHPSFQNVKCPNCGADARRDTDTMDTFVDSSWYFLRYTDARNEEQIFDPQKAARWAPVDLYVGGREHAILHLIYARFFTKFLHDIGLIDFDEPFSRLYSHGLIQGESRRVVTDEMDRYVSEDELERLTAAGKVEPGQVVRRIEKMSKSKLNGTDPTQLVAQYGADAVRLTILFMGPAEADSVWDDDGIKGPYNFLRRWHDLALSSAPLVEDLPQMGPDATINAAAKKLRFAAHSLVEKATGEFEGRFALNTVIAKGMELVNEIRAFITGENLTGPCKGAGDPTLGSRWALGEAFDILARTMAPFAPHTAEEVWHALGGKQSVLETPWPKHDPAALVLDEIELPVQVNGKVRGTIKLPATADKPTMERLALENENVKKFVEGKAIQKLIVVPGKIINVVAK